MTTDVIEEKTKNGLFEIRHGSLLSTTDSEGVRFELFSTLGKARLWEAFINREERVQWFGEMDIAKEIGDPFLFAAGRGHTHAGETLLYKEGERVEVSWIEVGDKTKVGAERSVATFEFYDVEGGGLFVYTQKPLTKLTKYGAGTHAHIEMFAAYLQGESFTFHERYEYWLPFYEKVFGPLAD